MPTVTVLAVMKARLQGATKGHALLKKKADALNMRFRQILKKIVQTKEEMGKVMKASFFALAQAKYATGDFRHTVFDSVTQVSAGGGREPCSPHSAPQTYPKPEPAPPLWAAPAPCAGDVQGEGVAGQRGGREAPQV